MKSGCMKQILIKASSIIASICFLIALLISLIHVICFNRSFFAYEYEKNNQAEVIGMNGEDLMEATDVLLDYLQEKRDDISIRADINGMTTEVFTTRESMHMADVRNLYQNALTVGNVSALICAVLVIMLGINLKQKAASVFVDGLENALFMIGWFIGCIVIWAILDFSNFWMDFHYIFFDNDLFLLDASRSVMINMFPESFFADLVFAIIICFSVICGMIYFGLKRYEQWRMNHDTCRII